jgi:hypothetical protein
MAYGAVPSVGAAAAAAAGVALLAGATAAFAGVEPPGDMPVAEYVSGGNYGIFTVAHSATITTFLSPSFGVFSGEGTLCETPAYTSPVSTTFQVSFADDPDFARYVELLTDGNDWYLYDQLNFDDNITKLGTFHLESIRLFPDDEPPPDDTRGGDPVPVDLKGFEITRIVRSIDLVWESPGSNPNGDGNWTDLTFEIRTQIYAVPEPAVTVPAALAAGWLLKRRARRALSRHR